MKLLLLIPLLALASCGATVCYTDPTTGIRVCEKIDGEFNPQIDLDNLTIDNANITITPAK